MNSILTSVNSLMEMFEGKIQEFSNEIDTVHKVWLKEIQQEANRMFSSDFNAEPELMPKTPSQKKNSRRKRVSVGRQDERPAKRFSKGRRSNTGSAVKMLQLVKEEQSVPDDMDSKPSTSTQSKRPPRKNKRTKQDLDEDLSQSVSPSGSFQSKEVENKKPELNLEEDEECVTKPVEIPASEVVVIISPEERLSAELHKKPELSPGRTAAKIAIAEMGQASRRSSVRHSLKLRHSVAGLRHSRTQESVRRASRRSMAKKKAARMGNSTCSSNISVRHRFVNHLLFLNTQIIQSVSPPSVRITRSVAANSPFLQQKASSRSTKRKAPETVEGSPSKRLSPPKKSHSAIRPNMRSFLHTVQKNQMLMMTPNSYGRPTTIKSFIKHTTPLKLDSKTKERHKLEALKKKQETKMVKIDEKNDKEEEKRQQEIMAKQKAEEEEQARKLAEARRAQERELERERQAAAAAAERVEREKALALKQELEKAAREKEKREMEEKKKALEQKKKLVRTGHVFDPLQPTSPQSYVISPKGGSKPLIMSKNLENYGMDQNSDDSTDDESAPRKPIPSWAEGHHLQQIIMKQYFNPPGFDAFFGAIKPPKLENIFYKSKPRYFKRTSSAVWHSPLAGAK
uniref:Inner centromere protein ARK-binding domain-containing protein n=1 Tax=Gouania willdenowi TaxID=441366 RepID=A0A8C5H1Q4_GOUWI